MIVNKIICDRCGEEIKQDHPDRFERFKYHKKTRLGESNFYKSVKKYHLCPKCWGDLEFFLDGGGV